MKKALGIVAVALFAYVVAYFSLVTAVPLPLLTGPGPWPRFPHYRIGGEAAKLVFRPIQALDKSIRPEFWLFTQQDLDEERREAMR